MTYHPHPSRRALARLAVLGALWVTLTTYMALHAPNPITGTLITVTATVIAAPIALWSLPGATRLTITDEHLHIRALPHNHTLRWDTLTAIHVQHTRDATNLRGRHHTGGHTPWVPLDPFITAHPTDWPQRIIEHADRHGITISADDGDALLSLASGPPETGGHRHAR